MKKAAKSDEKKLKEQAVSIASEIFNLITQYTHDSATSKFFLPEEISASFYIAAGGFASVIYNPQLEADEIQKTHALTFFIVLVTYGFQIYLKERSLKTNAAPYRIPTDTKQIEAASLLVLEKAENGDLISSPLSDEIIILTVKQLQSTISLHDFSLDEHSMDEKKLYSYMVIALYYGYNMASFLLHAPKK